MISLAIMALLGGVIAISTQKLLLHHRYKAEVDEFTSLCVELQRMATLYNQSFSLKVENLDQGVHVEVELSKQNPLSFAHYNKHFSTLKHAYSSLKKRQLFNACLYFFPDKTIDPEGSFYFDNPKMKRLQGIEIKGGKIKNLSGVENNAADEKERVIN